MSKKIWTVIKNGRIKKVTFPDEQPKPQKELEWFRLYQPENEAEK